MLNLLSCHVLFHFKGSKYVPPHLRKSQGSGANHDNNNNNSNNNVPPNSTQPNESGGSSNSNPPPPSQNRSSYSNNSNSNSYYNGGGGGGGGRGGGRGYNNNNRSSGGGYQNHSGSDRNHNHHSYDHATPPPPTSTSSRWNNTTAPSSTFTNGGGGRSFGGGGSSSSYSSSRCNVRGFHGEMTPDVRLEQRLFHQPDKQTTGINFDNYDKIPCEVSGADIPDPIEVYTVDTIGEDLFRNTQLCNYSRPTPVQKYSIPIGQQGRDLMACAQTGSGVRSLDMLCLYVKPGVCCVVRGFLLFLLLFWMFLSCWYICRKPLASYFPLSWP
jgi:ATP-dependent RNA helicase DDX3X